VQTLAVMMVKDEGDVIGGTVEHLVDEVDHIFVADNASTDGTRDILATLERDHPGVHVFDDPDPAYYQSEKMTALAALAAEAVGDPEPWIVPVDADELWYWDGDRIAVELQQITERIVAAPIFNHFTTDVDPPATHFPFESIVYRQAAAGALPKVAFRWEPGAVIHQGNHGVTLPSGRMSAAPGHGLKIRHFPYRSLAQFILKARNGAAAYAATDLPVSEGAHWREYGALFEQGGWEALADVYNTWFHFKTPVTSGLVHDPAPFLRWRRPRRSPEMSEALQRQAIDHASRSDHQQLGHVAYDAYGDERGWTVVGGGVMPTWADQSDDLRRAWQAAAEAVVSELYR
jgi:hypothetical protein